MLPSTMEGLIIEQAVCVVQRAREVNCLKESHLLNVKTITYLARKFSLTEADVNMEIEILKRMVTAVAHNIHKYETTISSIIGINYFG